MAIDEAEIDRASSAGSGIASAQAAETALGVYCHWNRHDSGPLLLGRAGAGGDAGVGVAGLHPGAGDGILYPLPSASRPGCRGRRDPVLSLMAGLVYYSSNQAIIFVQDFPNTRRPFGRRFRRSGSGRNRWERGARRTAKAEPRPGTDWEDLLRRGFGSVSQALLAASFVPFLVYFMLSWQHHVRSATVMLFSLENRNTAYITLGLISAMIRSFMVGNLLIGLFLGTASTIAFGF